MVTVNWDRQIQDHYSTLHYAKEAGGVLLKRQPRRRRRAQLFDSPAERGPITRTTSAMFGGGLVKIL